MPVVVLDHLFLANPVPLIRYISSKGLESSLYGRSLGHQVAHPLMSRAPFLLPVRSHGVATIPRANVNLVPKPK